MNLFLVLVGICWYLLVIGFRISVLEFDVVLYRVINNKIKIVICKKYIMCFIVVNFVLILFIGLKNIKVWEYWDMGYMLYLILC